MPILDPPGSGYSAEGDLLLGNIPLPAYASAEKYITDAQNEIDSVVGFIYETPLDVSESSAMVKPARLLIKRISNWLATGRIVLAIAAASERQELNAYGANLVKQAETLLQQIGNGEVVLEGAVTVESKAAPFAGPQIYNKDPESNVEAFYDRVANPRVPVWPFGDSERRLIR